MYMTGKDKEQAQNKWKVFKKANAQAFQNHGNLGDALKTSDTLSGFLYKHAPGNRRSVLVLTMSGLKEFCDKMNTDDVNKNVKELMLHIVQQWQENFVQSGKGIKRARQTPEITVSGAQDDDLVDSSDDDDMEGVTETTGVQPRATLALTMSEAQQEDWKRLSQEITNSQNSNTETITKEIQATAAEHEKNLAELRKEHAEEREKDREQHAKALQALKEEIRMYNTEVFALRADVDSKSKTIEGNRVVIAQLNAFRDSVLAGERVSLQTVQENIQRSIAALVTKVENMQGSVDDVQASVDILAATGLH